MKSGLEGRNNELPEPGLADGLLVSMKSGLEGRNNAFIRYEDEYSVNCLNEVRPRRPEQLGDGSCVMHFEPFVSMKSGLEGRNNQESWLSTSPPLAASQ